MSIEQYSINEFIKIIDVSLIKQGDMIWKDGDIVQIKDVEVYENRIEVWNEDKSMSELIYDYELNGISKVNMVNETNKLNTLNEEIALRSIINNALRVFPKSFINRSNEIILEPKNNLFFRLEDVNTELDFKCKMFAWVSRPIAKSLNKYWSPRVLKSFNELLGTNFTKDEMYKIYDRLGNDVNRKLTIRFIESNYDLVLLERN